MNNGKIRSGKPEGKGYGLTERKYAGFVDEYPVRKDTAQEKLRNISKRND